MEFWKEDTLRAIVEQAGDFCCADAATVAKNRGSFARVAVRVDLSCPLRPGTRVQGLRGPFWQQFAFEALEGFCPLCGSLHLDGPCSEEVLSEKAGSGSSFVFGPWLAAVRQRRLPAAPLGKPTPSPGSPSSKAPVHDSVTRPEAKDTNQLGGWQVPSKLRRRRPTGSVQPASARGKGGEASVAASGSQVVGSSKGPDKGMVVLNKEAGEFDLSNMVAVPVFQGRAGFKLAEAGRKLNKVMGSSEIMKSQSLVNANPFASLDLVSNEAGNEENPIMVSGPLKRARPADGMPPRPIPKLDKRKGKGKGKMVNCNVDLIPSTHGLPLAFSGQVSGKEEGRVIQERPVDCASETPAAMYLGQESLKSTDGTEVLLDGTIQNGVDRSRSVEHHMDSLMIEDQGAAPTSSK